MLSKPPPQITNNMTVSPNQEILEQLRLRSALVASKDGSQGLDVLSSLHQYIKAYDLTRARISTGAQVLDWGGGSGHFSYFLNKAGYKTYIYAFEEPQFIQQEIADGEISYRKANANEPVLVNYPNESFDAVCSIGVLEHVREVGGDERASLQEISRLLKPGGIFLCYHLPNKGSWIEFLAKRFGSYHHQYTYNQEMINTIFKDVLHIKVCERYALLPRNSLRRLPKSIADNRYFARSFNVIDSILCSLLPWINQNWVIVATKPHSSATQH
jgi:ubiquinone/menaquinone biosynthesis C-methylase UbiE